MKITSQQKQLFIELLIVFVALSPMLFWYGNGDVENDEAIYSFAARHMAETGEWLTPVGIYPGNPPFLEKPPLKMWLTAASFALGVPDDNNWGLRFVDILLTVAVFVYMVLLGSRFGGRWAGALTGLAFVAFKFPLLSQGMLLNKMESILVLQYVASMYHFTAWIEGTPRKAAHAAAIGGYFVLGFMSKFVAALFLPLTLAVVLFIHPTLLRRFLGEFRLWLTVGVACFMLIAPWFVYQHLAAGPAFWRDIFGRHVFERLTHYLDETHLNPWYFYVETTARMILDQGAFLAYPIGLIVMIALDRWQPRQTALFAWYLVPVAAMSAMTSKLHYYIYPFVPALAVVCGVGLARLAASPLTWPRGLAFLIATVPLANAYVGSVQHLRNEPGPFTALRACLGSPAATALFDANAPTNHVFTYYGFLDHRQASGEALADAPGAVWIARDDHRALLAAGHPRAVSDSAYLMPLAQVATEPGRKQPAVLLLPEAHAHCADRILSAGASPARTILE